MAADDDEIRDRRCARPHEDAHLVEQRIDSEQVFAGSCSTSAAIACGFRTGTRRRASTSFIPAPC